jgi:carboxymethylenebutenolidase
MQPNRITPPAQLLLISQLEGSRTMKDIKPNDPGRREFLATLIATGYALAVQPVTAQTLVMTDTAGITDALVKIPNRDFEFPAYMAHPAKGKGFPVVLVVQEIFGVHEHIKDVCRRLAKLGYLAIAPELYARQGNVASLTDFQDILKIVSKVPDAQVMSDIDATLAYVAKYTPANSKRLGITGFCWGGRITWLYCAHNPQVQAGVAWYGKLSVPVTELQPQHPVDIAARLTVPVLGLYGAADQGIPMETVEKMKQQLALGKSGSTIQVYADTPHAFFADYRPSYRKEAAEDAWLRLQQWFADRLK